MSSVDHDAFGQLDLSGTDPSGRVGCMARRLADLDTQERRLLEDLRFVRAAQEVAMAALDRFIKP